MKMIIFLTKWQQKWVGPQEGPKSVFCLLSTYLLYMYVGLHVDNRKL